MIQGAKKAVVSSIDVLFFDSRNVDPQAKFVRPLELQRIECDVCES